MKELTDKIECLESLILKFAQSKIEDANDKFARTHGYDLRKTDNNDHLKFYRWELDENEIVLLYGEVTPHDCPYSVELRYKTDALNINCA